MSTTHYHHHYDHSRVPHPQARLPSLREIFSPDILGSRYKGVDPTCAINIDEDTLHHLSLSESRFLESEEIHYIPAKSNSQPSWSPPHHTHTRRTSSASSTSSASPPSPAGSIPGYPSSTRYASPTAYTPPLTPSPPPHMNNSRPAIFINESPLTNSTAAPPPSAAAPQAPLVWMAPNTTEHPPLPLSGTPTYPSVPASHLPATGHPQSPSSRGFRLVPTSLSSANALVFFPDPATNPHSQPILILGAQAIAKHLKEKAGQGKTQPYKAIFADGRRPSSSC